MKRYIPLLFIGVLLVLSAASLQIAQVPETTSTLPKPNESPLFVERYAELQPDERVSVQVYERCNRSIVNIDTQITYNSFFAQGVEPGAGSGIVFDKEGHILTNFHVIANVDSAQVTLFNGETYDATLVGGDPHTDLAIIQIKAPKESLFPIADSGIADSSKLLVGQQIFAIGNPFGLERTLTSGLISSLNRSIPSQVRGRNLRGLIQTDAAINPGNSGGALLDSQGKLIGINTAIASKSGGSHGIGFAIPARTIQRIVPQLIRNGRVIRGEPGIEIVREVVRELSNGSEVQGLMVGAMVEEGPAERAGLRGPKLIRVSQRFAGMEIVRERRDFDAADVITAVDGVPVKKTDDFTAIVDERKPGDRVVLDIAREGKIIKVPLTLE